MSDDASRVGFRLRQKANPPRARLAEEAALHSSCDLSDMMNRSHTMRGLIPSDSSIARIAGPATTIDAVAPSLGLVKAGLAMSQRGDVLLVTTHGDDTHAVWGGNLASLAAEKGLAGVVVDGAVRDLDEIRLSGLPTFYSAIAASAAPAFVPHGEVNVPISCGGIVVQPGDIVVADRDGIVVLPVDDAEQVLMSAEDASGAPAYEHSLAGLDAAITAFTRSGYGISHVLDHPR